MITDIYRKNGGRNGSITKDAAAQKETWYVEVDDPTHEVEFILAAFAQPGTVYAGRLVEGLSAQESADGYSWLVDVSYTKSAIENPLDEPLKVSGSQSAKQVPVEFDRDGDPILNTAGDPFQEILFAEDFDDTLQLTFNTAAIPFAAAQAAKKTVSSAAVLGLPAGTVRYAGMSFQPQDHETLGTYYTITINLALADDWKTRLLNQGFRELNDDGDLVAMKVDGQPASQPLLLDNAGKRLASDGTPVTLEKDIYGQADYLTLFGIA